MLLELRVQNLGIIEDMTWRLGGGLNVITGETGAGKSLVIDAIELLLAGKAGEEAIRYGTNAARIEGVFALKEGGSPLNELLSQKGLSADEDTLAVSCELRRQAPAVIRLNGHAIPRAFLRQLGRLLVDIHGQSEHLSLLDIRAHLDYLDAYAHTLDLRESFAAKAAGLAAVQEELKSLDTDEKERARREEYLRFQLDEIRQAKLKDGEEAELEREHRIMASTETLKALSFEAYRILLEDELSHNAVPALDRLNEAVMAMKKLAELDPSLKDQLDYLNSSISGLTEVARDIRAYSERLEFDPERLEQVESRLELIKGLKRKYGQTIADVLNFLEKGEKEMEGLQHSTEKRGQLEAAVDTLKQEMGRIAAKLSQERTKAAKRLIGEVKNELDDLNMGQVKFEVDIRQQPELEGIPFPDGKSYAFTNDGVDIVEFMVSTNPGEPVKPLAKVASTGELSRFTLALKGALSEADNIPVMVFDEIDIGVGGRSGEIIGKKLYSLAKSRQVVCVTHLPQIAAFADVHFSVHKEVRGERTVSRLENLDDESRIKELAVMLAGAQVTRTSTTSARELVHKAEAWKKSGAVGK